MRKEHAALLDRMLEDELLDGDRELINELIIEDAEFCEAYICYNDLHNNLSWTAQPAKSAVTIAPPPKAMPPWLFALAGAAAVIIAGIAFEVSRQSAMPPEIATVTDTPKIAETEGTIHTGEIRLQQGEADFMLENGVRLQIAGPAHLDVADPELVKLIGGRLDVEVPSGAEGFTVETDIVSIVDLGTAFAVSADTDQTVVSVRLGKVEVRSDTETLIMEGGMSAVFRRGEGLSRYPLRIEDADRLEQAFELPVSTFTGIVAPAVKASGAVRWIDVQTPADLKLTHQRSSEILVIPEKRGVHLDFDLAVDCASAGTYSEFDKPTRKISAGTVVDIYRLRLHPEKKDRAMAAMTFPSLIRGVICTTELLAQTDALVGLKPIRTRGRGLESRATDANNDDAVTINENRRSLTVVMEASVYDEIRIFVESQ